MTPSGPSGVFADVIARVDHALEKLLDDSPLSIAVLGPALNMENPGSRKRRQIHDALQKDGHKPFYPEDIVVTGTPKAIVEEREILSKPSVDWIILLHTQNGHGTIGELSNFAEHDAIVAKTTVLFPQDLYDPSGGLTANTVESFWAQRTEPLLYTDQQLASCNLVAECTALAFERLSDKSPLSWPFSRYLPW